MEKKYIIAVSGGPDSMALLNIYAKHIQLVCNINYNHRPTAKRDENIVKDYCKANNIKLKVLHVTKAIYSKYQKNDNNFQTVARKIRYDFFLKCAKEINNRDILIAHNYDDFLETAVMQMKKKSKALYYGIKDKNTYKGLNIIRPLINKRKAALEEYCLKNGINYGIDESNLTDIYERNRIRKEIQKMSKQQFNSLVNKINTYNKKNSSLSTKIDVIYSKWSKINFCCKYFSTIKDKRVRYYLVYNFLSENNIKNISSSKINGIIEFICNGKNDKQYRISDTIKLSRVNNHLSLI
ncbi:MAG: tRNA lysidine(34) synthetase TilS [Mycoplasmataceae bacterium]|nr:tRNA lysidine(34) synthetase TilS [Mycoplasmataceae bacterium]